MSLPLRPRPGLKANITSGARDPNNPNLKTFNPLFPKGAYFSEDGDWPANQIDLNPSVLGNGNAGRFDFRPLPDLGQKMKCSVNLVNYVPHPPKGSP